MSSLRLALVVAAAALAISACGSAPVEKSAEPASAPAATPPAPPPPPPPPKAMEKPMDKSATPMQAPIDPLNDPANILSHRSVYFGFDRWAINDADLPVVDAHGRYLAQHAERGIRIEGNCDERGGREYNLALGQRRANAVRDHLKALGVADSRIESLSLGKEKPRNAGHDEAAWAENRRADILYK